MAQAHIQQLRDIVIEWHGKDPSNGDIESYSMGFADGLKFTIKRLTEMGIEIPDADLFMDD